MKKNSNTILYFPTQLIIFGVTGDLAAKKIIPSLYHLFAEGRFPKKIKIIGFSRRDFGRKEMERMIISILRKHKDIRTKTKKIKQFIGLFSYTQGNFSQRKDYNVLYDTLQRTDAAWGMCTNKLFYLAVPPQYYESIFKNLAASKLTEPCGKEEGLTPLENTDHSVTKTKRQSLEQDSNRASIKHNHSLTGWTRVIVEKPFGRDLATAKRLDALLSKLFKEEQIFRIDHYLAKEILQNVLSFRFSNNLFEHHWNSKIIERITVTLWEKIGVKQRGAFYDGVGALRDVGQNHLLQMLALVSMEHPIELAATTIRTKRAQILSTLKCFNTREVAKRTLRGQYRGYRTIPGVKRNSDTETFFHIDAELTAPRWQGVPIILEAGKAMPSSQKHIEVLFRHPSPCLCPPGTGHLQNRVTFELEPEEKIVIDFWTKKPGLGMQYEKQTLTFNLRESKRGHTAEAYEKLLLDCFTGDQTSFVSTNEVEAMWRFVDPIIAGWQKGNTPLLSYKAHTAPRVKKEQKTAQKRTFPQKREIAVIGLGKMGKGIARRLMENGWRVVGYNRTGAVTDALAHEGIIPAHSITEAVEKLIPPRLVWIMVPAGKPVDGVIKALLPRLAKGDIVIDGGNSFYKDSIRRSHLLRKHGIHFIDVGVSGGPRGARYGASLMIGGEKKISAALHYLFEPLAVEGGYAFFPGAGAGHFVKMVHNGIEYGMMQAIAEGFNVMRKSKYKLNLTDVARVYNHGSVIESKLVGWVERAFKEYGEQLTNISGTVAHTGEGAWTVKTAQELHEKINIIAGSLAFRKRSEQHPDYTGKVLSALRNQFGGHKALK